MAHPPAEAGRVETSWARSSAASSAAASAECWRCVTGSRRCGVGSPTRGWRTRRACLACPLAQPEDPAQPKNQSLCPGPGVPFVGPHASREPPRRPHWRHWRGRRSAREPRTNTPRAEPTENARCSWGPMPCFTSRRRAGPAFISAARPPLPRDAMQRPSAPPCEATTLCPTMRSTGPLLHHLKQRASAPGVGAMVLCSTVRSTA